MTNLNTSEKECRITADKTYIFLGSSVTYGSAAGGKSFVENIAEQYGCRCVKEAVSGTTLVDNGSSSYVARIKTIDGTIAADAFICQLSTNDASQNKPLGSISNSENPQDFDTSTIIGAIEYIISYAQKTWACPICFYTGTRYESTKYQEMTEQLYKLREKWGITIIDLWNDDEMNSVSAEEYAKYMSDPIHPTALGYREWWTPKFAAHLEKLGICKG